jgi:hypothetical protein
MASAGCALAHLGHLIINRRADAGLLIGGRAETQEMRLSAGKNIAADIERTPGDSR